MITGSVDKAIDKFVEDIKDELRKKDIRIRYLEKQNQALYDEHYKDNQLSQLKNELETMKANYYRGFPMSQEEYENIQKWINNHEKEAHGCNTLRNRLAFGGCCGGTYTYEFVPTSIGTVGTVKCKCGAEFTFQNTI